MHVMIPALTPNDVSKPFHSVGMTPNDPTLTFLARVPLSLCQARINSGIEVVQLTPMMTPVVTPTMSSDVLVSNHVTQYLLQISLLCQRDTVLNSFQGQVLDKAIGTWPVSIPNTPKPRKKNLETNLEKLICCCWSSDPAQKWNFIRFWWPRLIPTWRTHHDTTPSLDLMRYSR